MFRKRIMTVLLGAALSALLIVSVCAEEPRASEYEDVNGDFIFEDTSLGIRLIRYTGTESTVTIPPRVNGKAVTQIGEECFKDCAEIEDVFLPGSLTTLETSAFSGCTALTDIHIPNNLISIGDWAFSGCSSLQEVDIVTYNSLLRDLGEGAFSGCTSLEEISFPSGVRSVPDALFKGCSSLEKVDFSVAPSEIGAEAFRGCAALNNFHSLGRAGRIGASAFEGCSSMETVHFSEVLSKLETAAFKNCTSLKEVQFEEGITEIQDSAFENCSSLSEVYLVSGMEKLGTAAFRGCTSLESVAVPQTLISVGANVFDGCERLKNVCYQGSEEQFRVTVSGAEAGFPEPSWYYEIIGEDGGILKNTGRIIQVGAGIGSGSTIEIPGDIAGLRVTAVADGTFADSEKAGTIVIPDSVVEIGTTAFTGSRAEAFAVSDGNRKYCSADGVIYSKDGKELAAYPEGRGGSFEIPDTVTAIGAYAFSGNTGLTELTIPISVTEIRENAFSGSRLKSAVYMGSQEQWGRVVINREGNQSLLDAMNVKTPEYHTVRFAAFGVSDYEEQSVENRGLAEEPAEIPEREGYRFLGWYDGETKWNFEKDPVIRDLLLTAKWETSVEPVYDSGGIPYDSSDRQTRRWLVPAGDTVTAEISDSMITYKDFYTINWKTSDDTVAALGNGGERRTEIAALNPGTAEITCTITSYLLYPHEDVAVTTAVYRLRVVESAARIEFETDSLHLSPGGSDILGIATYPEGNWARYVAGFSVVSSDPSVARVTEDGSVLAVGEGEAVITARLENGAAAECRVTVGNLPQVIRGDVDQDGAVDIRDLRMVLRSVCGKIALTEVQEQAADVETDGEVDIKDLRKILRYVCKKISVL